MVSRLAPRLRRGSHLPALAALCALALNACNPAADTASAPVKTDAEEVAEQEEYGEFYARPEELAPVAVNDIVKSMRMNATAMYQGERVYARACAQCHGADLKGLPGKNAPDLTDANWRFSGDDLASGGGVKLPSDVEWTVRYGIRSGHANARGLEADMVAFDPQYRNAEDTREHGSGRFLSDDEIGDVIEYVMKIGGQPADDAKATRGDTLFHDGTKGNCNDCHDEGGTGNPSLGSTNLAEPRLYLYGSDRAAVLESIVRGRRGTMPAFDGQLKPEEIKAVSIYVFSRAAKAP
jgi:cytochrome c oxidase cbb3-type subunit 3